MLAGATNGDGEVHPQALIVARDTPGLTVGERERNMGLKALATTGLVLDACKVPRENLLECGDTGEPVRRLAQPLAGRARRDGVGVARAAYDYARDYAKERRAFGRPSRRSRRSPSCSPRWRSRSTPRDCSSGKRRGSSIAARTRRARPALAKHYAADMALKVTDNAVQVLGGHGYIRDHLVELFLRNARGFAIFEGLAIA